MILKIRQFASSLSENQIIWLISLLAALLAWRVLYIQQGWINDDSVLYFEVARLFGLGAWREGWSLFNWPFYPLLIAGLNWLTGASLQHSAQILSVLFFSITSFSFSKLILMADGNKHTIIAGSLLLFASTYITGDVLSMLLRDQGFWAFLLTSIVFFLCFYRTETLKYAILWQLSAIIATLFRVEAITYLVLLPMVLWVRPNTDLKLKLLLTLKVHSVNLMLLLIVVTASLLYGDLSIKSFGRLQEVTGLFTQDSLNLFHLFINKSQLLGNSILGSFLDEYAGLSLAFTLLMIVAIKCATTAGWLPLALLIFQRKLKIKIGPMECETKKIFCWVAILGILNATVIIFRSYVLSSRYVIAFAFILLIFAAFVLASLGSAENHSDNENKHFKKWLFPVCVLIIFLCIVKNVWPKPDGYNFEQDAVRYITSHYKKTDKVFYVSPRARYYAGTDYISRGYDYEMFIQRAIADHSINDYNVLALNMPHSDKKTAELVSTLPQFNLVKVFYSPKKNKKVMVFEHQPLMH